MVSVLPPAISGKATLFRLKPRTGWLIITFGVIVPVVAIICELHWRICALNMFDPLPTHLHVLLVALVPLSNLLILLATRRNLKEHYAFLCLLNGMASGIALTYSLMFLPLLPISLALVLLFGFGLLGLCPLLSFLTSLGAGKIISTLTKSEDTYFEPHHSQHLGHLLIIASIIAVELPSTLTRIHLHMAAEPSTAIQGLDWLRHYGNEEVMLRACYERSGKATDIIGSLYEAGHPLDVEVARNLFYRVTGKPFNSVAIPATARATMQHGRVAENGAIVTDEFDVDTDVAGEVVSGVARGVSLSESSLTGELHPKSATAELKWTFTIANKSANTREARAKIILPTGTALNSVGLTIDGKKLDGTLKLRSIARSQYKKSVSRGSDPLLLSYCGQDEILIQCWPIKQNSAVVVSLSMVVPLSVDPEHVGSLGLPYLEEHNFSINAPYDVSITSDAPIVSTINGASLSRDDSKFIAKAHIKNLIDAAHGQLKTSVALAPPVARRLVKAGASIFEISEKIQAISASAPRELLIVVDGSASMNKYKNDLAAAFAALPGSIPARIIAITDTASTSRFSIDSAVRLDRKNIQLKNVTFAGGQNDNAAIKAACDFCLGHPGAAVLWIHGAQPIMPLPAEKIALPEKQSPLPLLYDLQVEPGANETLSNLMHTTGIRKIHSTGKCDEDLTKLFSEWSQKTPPYRLLLVATAVDEIGQNESSTRDDVTTLWAVNRINEGADSIVARSILARDFNLVTPISSAIVHDPNPVQEAPTEKPYLARRSLFDFERFNPASTILKAQQEAVSQLNSLSAGAPYAQQNPESRGSDLESLLQIGRKTNAVYSKKGLVGAAVDPAYGQADVPVSSSQTIKTDSTFSADKQKSGSQNEPFFETAADEAAPVPEPDGILLLFISALAIFGTVLFKFRRRAQKA